MASEERTGMPCNLQMMESGSDRSSCIISGLNGGGHLSSSFHVEAVESILPEEKVNHRQETVKQLLVLFHKCLW